MMLSPPILSTASQGAGFSLMCGPVRRRAIVWIRVGICWLMARELFMVGLFFLSFSLSFFMRRELSCVWILMAWFLMCHDHLACLANTDFSTGVIGVFYTTAGATIPNGCYAIQLQAVYCKEDLNNCA